MWNREEIDDDFILLSLDRAAIIQVKFRSFMQIDAETMLEYRDRGIIMLCFRDSRSLIFGGKVSVVTLATRDSRRIIGSGDAERDACLGGEKKVKSAPNSTSPSPSCLPVLLLTTTWAFNNRIMVSFLIYISGAFPLPNTN